MPATVLVVEDEVLVAEDIRQILWGFGYEVLAVVANSAEALEVAANRRPDVALVDIGLHGAEDGVDIARRLQEAHGVGIVFLTSHAEEETLARAMRARPSGYLIKPFVERELRTAIEVALGARAHEARQAEREGWLRAVLAAIPDAVLVVDPAGVVTFVNPKAAELTSWTARDAVGRPLAEVRSTAAVPETASSPIRGEDGRELGRVFVWTRASR